MTTDAAANSYHQAPTGQGGAPRGCPVHATWSPLDADYLADPYPIARDLREQHPVFFAERFGHLTVTRMEDIDAIFMQPEVFASTNVQDPIFPLAPEAAAILSAPDFNPVAVMSNRSEPDHGRIRVHTRQGFSNRRLRSIEEYLRGRAKQLIDQMLAAGSPADYVQSVAFPLPAEIVFQFIGFPAEDYTLIKSWCVNRRAFSWGQPSADEQVRIAGGMLDYWRYCRAFVADRKANRTDDFCSELLDAHEADDDPSGGTGLTYREVESIIYGFSFAGHDPVTSLLTNTLRCLLARRDQWDALCADVSLAANAVEETLRFESSQISWRRITTQDTTVGGIDVPAGTRIYLNFAAANHQPDLFAEPDVFDIHRANANRHTSFGKGIHFCLGAGLARLEARIALELLVQRVPSLRLVEGQELTFFPNVTFRGPDRLLVEWDT